MPENKLDFEDDQVIDGDQLIVMALQPLESLWTQKPAKPIPTPDLRRWRISEDLVEVIPRRSIGRNFVFDRTRGVAANCFRLFGWSFDKQERPFQTSSLRILVQPYFGPELRGLKALENLLPDVSLVLVDDGDGAPIWFGRWIISDSGLEFVYEELEALAAAIKWLGISIDKPQILPAKYKAPG